VEYYGLISSNNFSTSFFSFGKFFFTASHTNADIDLETLHVDAIANIAQI